ncbi:uncharacterized protein LOC118188649, partial [Stegodyphus dumicola]|uniref:uncharacterized protein LOC118188649 n=1 Tax=Stegodyphus dumicola TaxID=202533 RepID=UPI0015B320B2
MGNIISGLRNAFVWFGQLLCQGFQRLYYDVIFVPALCGHTFTKKELDDYKKLTYLSKSQIYKAHRLFLSFCTSQPSETLGQNLVLRWEMVEDHMPELWASPFKDRLRRIFCSRMFLMSFEDFLQMMSVFSDSCPKTVKAEYAFRLYVKKDNRWLAFLFNKKWYAVNDSLLSNSASRENICVYYGQQILIYVYSCQQNICFFFHPVKLLIVYLHVRIFVQMLPNQSLMFIHFLDLFHLLVNVRNNCLMLQPSLYQRSSLLHIKVPMSITVSQ